MVLGFCDIDEEQMQDLMSERSEVNVKEMLDDDEGKEEAEQKSEAHEKPEITTLNFQYFWEHVPVFKIS